MKNEIKKHTSEDLHKQVLDNYPIVCCDIICLFEDRYLLIKRNNNPAQEQFWFPGSRIFKNETIAEAAVRTIKEECGLEAVYRKNYGVAETIFNEGTYENINTHSVNVIALVSVQSDNVVLDANHSEYKWIPCGSVPDFLDKNLKDFLNIAFLQY